MPGEDTKKVATDTELSQLLECMKILHASLAALTDSVEDLYLCSDMPTAVHLKNVMLDLISRTQR
jgi:hypothetical protein